MGGGERRGSAECGVCGRVLQRLEAAGEAAFEDIEALQRRIERVQAMGGAFGGVELSEHVGAVLAV